MLKRRTLIYLTLGMLLSIPFVGSQLAQGQGTLAIWSTPVNLGPVVNTQLNDRHPAISRNGLSLYITSDRPGGYGDLDIWVSQRASLNDPWGSPVNLGPNINTSGLENGPNLSSDGLRLYFGSTRAGGRGDADLYVSSRQNPEDDFGWGPPVTLDPTGALLINTFANDNGPCIFEDEATGITTLYFTSNRPGIGDFDIYASTQNVDGSFNSALVVPELSSTFRDTRLAIRRDGLEIFISTERPGGVEGDARDLWVSTRLNTNDPWGVPVNLGTPVNSRFTEGAPALSVDGTTLYFYSARIGGFGVFDLYVAKRTLPIVRTRNITVPSGESCVASISPSDVDDGSYESDGSDSLTLSLDPAGPFGLGRHTVRLIATDSHGATNSSIAIVTVVDQTPPSVTAPPAVTIATEPNSTSCGTFISDAALGTATANDNCSVTTTRTGVPDGNFFPVGTTTINYTATDGSGNTTSATQNVTVIDSTPPVITGAAVDKPTLWPPNHRMVDVTVNYAATDNCGTVGAVLSVSSNEPVNGKGDGNTAPDWEVVDAHHVRLRAERAGGGSGRIYQITITAIDSQGNTSNQMVSVRVEQH